MRVRVPRLIILPALLVVWGTLALSRPVGAGEADEKPQAPAAPVQPPSTDDILRTIRTRLEKTFDRHLENPASYRKRVAQTCDAFPEGDLFPYTFPALGYVNTALADPARKEHCIAQARKLVDLAIDAVSKRVGAPEGKLEDLPDYRKYATHLGQLNLVLGAYRLASDDTRYDRIHDRLSDLFLKALEKTKGLPLRSYPTYSWPMDTIPVLVSLKLHDIRTSEQRSDKFIRAHLAWVREHATHPELKLPYSRFNDKENKALELPRGCDLSLRLCLLPHIDRAEAERLYRDYVKSFWITRGVLAGFAEWPEGKPHFEDIDSGPIFMGIGLGATGTGIGTAKAINDQPRLRQLCLQLTSVDLLRTMFFASRQQGGAEAGKDSDVWRRLLDQEHYTGFLMGDAVLFYCVTWHPWKSAD